MQDLVKGLRLEFPRPVDLVALGARLRKSLPSSDAIWLLQQLELYWQALRLEAFRDPLPLWFERQALEMGSRWPLAERRAREIARRFPEGLLVEVGAGIGGDSLELAPVRPLRAIESHEQRRRCLEHNLRGTNAEVLGGDGILHLDGACSIYADPARRNAQGRQWKDLQPDPRLFWQMALPTCLKLAPGLDESWLPPGCDLDYVSHQGVCKEGVVWLPGRGRVQAWLYREGSWLTAERRPPPRLAALEPGMWLHEPDPAAIRAQVWLPLEAWRIDESLALLASEPGLRSPWAQSFEVLEIAEADQRSLVQLQKRHDFQPLEIKKRGFDVEPEQLRRKLPKGSRGGPGVLWLSRVAGRHRALVCRRV